MKVYPLCMCFVVLLSGLMSPPLGAQQRNPVVSPQVHADRTVTFRLQAPEARNVLLEADFLSPARLMRREADGLWSITVGPLAPGIYDYDFAVDGLKIPDPLNPEVKVWRRVSRNMLDVPGDPPMFFHAQAVPHGTVHIHQYRSKSLEVTRGLYVYTPPGYETAEGQKYPVLYLLHGSGDTELTWTVVGRANAILDNALAGKRALPMVVVMPYGHTPGAAARSRRHQAFETDLLEDVIPFVERTYRVRTDARHRAIAGLSMGGGQSLIVGLGHPDLFTWIGAFSSGVPGDEELDRLTADPAALNAKLELLWIGCGKSDFLFEANQRLLGKLKAKDIAHTVRITDGSHEWRLWRRYLNEILPLLFRPAP